MKYSLELYFFCHWSIFSKKPAKHTIINTHTETVDGILDNLIILCDFSWKDDVASFSQRLDSSLLIVTKLLSKISLASRHPVRIDSAKIIFFAEAYKWKSVYLLIVLEFNLFPFVIYNHKTFKLLLFKLLF